jgi:hypothetical protein
MQVNEWSIGQTQILTDIEKAKSTGGVRCGLPLRVHLLIAFQARASKRWYALEGSKRGIRSLVSLSLS